MQPIRVGPPRLSAIESKLRFLEIVSPHLGAAHALARSLTRSRADSEDIVQDACLRAFRGIAGFGGTNARAWVLTIVRHAAYDWLSKSRRAPEAIEDLESLVEQFELHQDTATPEAALVLEQDAHEIERAVQALPALFQNAFRLRHEQGLSYLEIAEAIGVPAGTVMSRLSRARLHLGETLGRMAA